VLGRARVSGCVFTANRSDGYTFTIFKEMDGTLRITAGCRYFSIPEAIDHWTTTRGETKLGKESRALVGHLELMMNLQDDAQNG
jgi:hypothetical protein